MTRLEIQRKLYDARNAYTKAQKDGELSLYPEEWRHLVCSLGVEAIV